MAEYIDRKAAFDAITDIAWKTAPETTANQYIVEHYGGTEK